MSSRVATREDRCRGATSAPVWYNLYGCKVLASLVLLCIHVEQRQPSHGALCAVVASLLPAPCERLAAIRQALRVVLQCISGNIVRQSGNVNIYKFMRHGC